ncbi:MAG: FHA domain-containing protein [Gammaproteobacteria bacterium]|jgi:pSer/pThr/pTyr-binding forkhead associated (FHA) protein|nr:FHA domain-containing protein [Gammaproteobacteria bacterium]MDP6536617.1 FHA domain-containing protein [Gammaproteobacteria bacterium]|tara:strand:+ start:1852 stop:2514 length:663 start_codon:yes stop_codon:yes gene_type:complete
MPGKLELSFNSTILGEYSLDKEVLTIGRKEDNDICIDNLAVSGHHAKLLTIFDDSFLEDLDSTNGTFIDGVAIEKHPLKNGDVFVIGKHELRYVNESASNEDDADKTVLIRPKTEQFPPPNPVADNASVDYEPEKIQAAGDDLDNARLQILNGSGAGKELRLSKASVKLGKSSAGIIQINKRPDGHFIVCLDQPSGTAPSRVNGEDIGARALKIEYFLAG